MRRDRQAGARAFTPFREGPLTAEVRQTRFVDFRCAPLAGARSYLSRSLPVTVPGNKSAGPDLRSGGQWNYSFRASAVFAAARARLAAAKRSRAANWAGLGGFVDGRGTADTCVSPLMRR